MDLNIRNVPADVLHKLKVASAQSGMTLRTYVLSKLMDEPKEAIRHVPRMPAAAPAVDVAPSYYVPAKYRGNGKR